MSKKTAVGLTASVILLAVLVIGIVAVDWDNYTTEEQPTGVPTLPSDNENVDIWDDNGELKENSLAYTIFENYAIILLPLALLMFGAMIGGVCISKEEVEEDDSN